MIVEDEQVEAYILCRENAKNNVQGGIISALVVGLVTWGLSHDSLEATVLYGGVGTLAVIGLEIAGIRGFAKARRIRKEYGHSHVNPSVL